MNGLLTTAEIAKELGYSYDYVRHLLRDSGFKPARTIGRSNLYSREQANRLTLMLKTDEK